MEGTFKYKPLKVLMTTDTVGGVWSYSLELCRAFIPFNVHFYLVTTGAPMLSSQHKEAEALENVTLYETDFKLEWMDDPWESIDASGAWLLKLEVALNPDLIHLNCYAYGNLPWKAPVMMVAHSDVWSWWMSVKKEQPPAQWREYYKRVRDGLHHADLILAPSQSMMHNIRSNYGVDTPGKTIYNGRSSGSFYTAQKQPVVFSMGRIWDEAKNIQLLIEAAAQIPFEIRIAGFNSFEGNVLSIDKKNILFLGQLSPAEIAAQLSVASVYVLPAKYEPFGLSVLEAALSGCALVLGGIESLQEIWKDSAIYIDTENAPALAETINQLMYSEDHRLDYAQKARQHAENYSTSAMIKNYYETYSELLRQDVLTQRNTTR